MFDGLSPQGSPAAYVLRSGLVHWRTGRSGPGPEPGGGGGGRGCRGASAALTAQTALSLQASPARRLWPSPQAASVPSAWLPLGSQFSARRDASSVPSSAGGPPPRPELRSSEIKQGTASFLGNVFPAREPAASHQPSRPSPATRAGQEPSGDARLRGPAAHPLGTGPGARSRQVLGQEVLRE